MVPFKMFQKILYYLVFFFFSFSSFSIKRSNSSQLYSELLSTGRFAFYRGFALDYIQYDLVPLGKFHPSPFNFDKDCISVVKTNSFLEHLCTLPHKCGRVNYWKNSESYFGAETVLCFSFHQSVSVNFVEFYRLEPKRTTVSYSFNNDKTYLSDFIPTDFFSHFVIALKPRLYILPAICLESYTLDSSKIPPSVDIRIESDTLKISHSVYNNTLCEPYYLDKIEDFIRTFDYPVAYHGCPYDSSSHEKYLNQAPFVQTYDWLHKSFPTTPYVYSVIRNRYGTDHVFVSYANISTLQRFKNYNYSDISRAEAHVIYSDGNQYLMDRTEYAYSISSVFRSPFTLLIDNLKEFFEHIFYKTLSLFESELLTFAQLIVKFLTVLIKFVFSDVILALFGSKFYTFLIIFSIIYFKFADYYKAIIIFSLIFWCDIVLFS